MMSRSEQKLFFPVGGKARNFFVFQVSFLSSRLAWKFDRDVSDGLLSAFEIWENNIPKKLQKAEKETTSGCPRTTVCAPLFGTQLWHLFASVRRSLRTHSWLQVEDAEIWPMRIHEASGKNAIRTSGGFVAPGTRIHADFES